MIVNFSNVTIVHSLSDTQKMEKEPEYDIFGGSSDLHHGMASIDHPTSDGSCEDCDIDYCHLYLFGEYCIAAVKRYYCNNKYIAMLRGACIVFEIIRIDLLIFILWRRGET